MIGIVAAGVVIALFGAFLQMGGRRAVRFGETERGRELNRYPSVQYDVNLAKARLAARMGKVTVVVGLVAVLIGLVSLLVL